MEAVIKIRAIIDHLFFFSFCVGCLLLNNILTVQVFEYLFSSVAPGLI